VPPKVALARRLPIRPARRIPTPEELGASIEGDPFSTLADFDSLEGLEALAPDALAPEIDPRSIEGGTRGGRRITVGRVNPQFATPAGFVDSEDDRAWMITVMGFPIIGAGAPLYTVLNLIVNFGVAGANYTRTVTLPIRSVPQKFTIVARHIDVAAWTTGSAFDASISIAPVSSPSGPAEYYGWTFFFFTGGFQGQVYTGPLGGGGPGVVGQLHVMYQTSAGAGPIYPLFFDALADPGNGALPLERLGGLFNIGDDRLYVDENAPGAIQFKTGLWVALSTTPDTLTKVTAGAIVVEAKIGT
jgi:hypothetical protein